MAKLLPNHATTRLSPTASPPLTARLPSGLPCAYIEATPAYTLAQAAEATGVNRSTILCAIKAGKISGQRDGQGTWLAASVSLPTLAAWEHTTNTQPKDHRPFGSSLLTKEHQMLD